MSFGNKIVLITGASSGIGAATAIAFAKEGADVAIVGRNVKKLESVVEKCTSVGKPPLSINADITHEGEVERIVKETIDKFGKIDVLVNNAGTTRLGTFLDCDADNILNLYDLLMNTNLRSHVQLTKLVAPYLIKSKGNIIFVSSISGIRKTSFTSNLLYGMSKTALDYFSRGVAGELAPHGVRVNTVSPGPVETDIMENAGCPNNTFASMLHRVPLNRVSEPEEVADNILFLASDKAKGITGANHLIDNGCLLK